MTVIEREEFIREVTRRNIHTEMWEASRTYLLNHNAIRELLTGMAVGGVVRYGARAGIAFLGFGGLWVPIGAGALSAASVEYYKQIRTNVSTNPLPAGMTFRERAAAMMSPTYLGPTSWRRLGVAAVRGAAGGFIGAEIADFLHPQPLENVTPPPKLQVPSVPGVAEGRTPGVSRLAEATYTPTSTSTLPTRAPTLSVRGLPTEVPVRPGVPIVEPTHPSIPTEAPTTLEAKVVEIENMPRFQEIKSADVGSHLSVIDALVRDVVHQSDVSGASNQALEDARMAIQHRMEARVNEIYDAAVRKVVAVNPNVPVGSLGNEIARQAQQDYDRWLLSTDTQNQLTTLAHQTLKGVTSQAASEQVISAGSFGSKVSEFLVQNPEATVEHVVKSGETAGNLLEQMGIGPTWDGMDWKAFAVLRELNPEAFSDLKTAMGFSNEQFEELIRRIQDGDHDAYRQLINKIGRIEAGKHLRILSAASMKRLLVSI